MRCSSPLIAFLSTYKEHGACCTQGIALSLGDKITLMQKAPPTSAAA